MSLFDFFRAQPSDPKGSSKGSSRTEHWEFQGKPVRLVLRPRRRRISIELRPGQPITVRGPLSLRRRDAEAFLQAQWPWVEKQWRKYGELPQHKPLDFTQPTQLYVKGQLVNLQQSVTSLKRPFLALTHSQPIELFLYLPESWRRPPQSSQDPLRELSAHRIWQQFLLARCELDVRPRLEAWASRMALQPTKVRFKHMRSRWGSCSSRGQIAINSRLVSAPDWVLDSVLVHELAHLRHMNHSRDFWALVAAYSPRHAEADQWLLQHAGLIP